MYLLDSVYVQCEWMRGAVKGTVGNSCSIMIPILKLIDQSASISNLSKTFEIVITTHCDDDDDDDKQPTGELFPAREISHGAAHTRQTAHREAVSYSPLTRAAAPLSNPHAAATTTTTTMPPKLTFHLPLRVLAPLPRQHAHAHAHAHVHASILTTTLSPSSLPTTTTPSARAAFSTTPVSQTKTIEVRSLPSLLIPAYPYGDNRIYKQSNHGLYAGARPRTQTVRPGRQSSAYKRTWRPNVSYKRFFSRALKAWVRTRLTTRVFRTIRKEGGIDNYVLKDKPARIKDLGPGGWKLRWLVMQAPRIRKRLDDERRQLGLWIEGVDAAEVMVEEVEEPSAEVIAEGETIEEVIEGEAGVEDVILEDAVSEDALARPEEASAAVEPQTTPKLKMRDPRMAVLPVPCKPGMLRVAMDYATPGKITKRSRDLMADYLAKITGMEEFGIGPDADLYCTIDNKAGPDREGSTLKAVREEAFSPAETVEAGQALQMRDMAGLVNRRNEAIRKGRIAKQLKRRYKKRM